MHEDSRIKYPLAAITTPLRYVRSKYSAVRRSRKNRLVACQKNLKRLSFSKFSKFKKSDTIYILGSGASVNCLSAEQWKKIGENDSLALNFWMLHDFVPTFYQFELPRNPLFRDYMIEKFSERSRDYNSVKFILKDPYKDEGFIDIFIRDVSSNIYVPDLEGIDAESHAELEIFLRAIRILRAWKISDKVFQKIGSASDALYISVALGYKNIVLVGFDLNTEYFYDDYDIPQFLRRGGQAGVVHKTADPSRGAITIDIYLLTFKREILTPCGISLNVSSRKSGLWPRLDIAF